MHAFDADHLATIGGLAVGNRSLSPMGYALRWALGHAAALVLIALARARRSGSPSCSSGASYAEILVCVALLAIGSHALRTRRGASARATPQRCAHAADPDAPHVHFLAPCHSHATLRAHRRADRRAARRRRARPRCSRCCRSRTCRAGSRARCISRASRSASASARSPSRACSRCARPRSAAPASASAPRSKPPSAVSALGAAARCVSSSRSLHGGG